MIILTYAYPDFFVFIHSTLFKCYLQARHISKYQKCREDNIFYPQVICIHIFNKNCNHREYIHFNLTFCQSTISCKFTERHKLKNVISVVIIILNGHAVAYLTNFFFLALELVSNFSSIKNILIKMFVKTVHVALDK